MLFLEPNQIREWIEEHSIRLTSKDTFEVSETSLVLSGPFGQAANPEGQEAIISMNCVVALGAWDECLLWVKEWGVWPSSEDWPAYYAARGQQGDPRSLEVAPGHLFESGENQLTVLFLQLILENAWEAQLVALSQGRPIGRIYISHDEWVEVWAPTDSSPTPRAV